MSGREQVLLPVRIPADVEVPDKILAGLTARQVLILAGGAALVYLVWAATGGWLPVLVGVGVPVGLVAVALALGRRDGLSMDAFALAALRHALVPSRLVAAGDTGPSPGAGGVVPVWMTRRATHTGPGGRVGLLAMPGSDVVEAAAGTEAGVVDLGADGLAVVAACGTVNFALRTPTEQQALVGVFARWLHALTGPAQVLVRAEHVDLSGYLTDLRQRAPRLPHPALEHAATDHANFLAGLAEHTDLLRRQVLLVLREPDARDPVTAGARLAHRLDHARRTLAGAGITVTALDPSTAIAVLTIACDPATDRPATALDGWAPPGTVITTPHPDPDWQADPNSRDEATGGGERW